MTQKQLDKIEVVDDREPKRVSQLTAYTYALRRMQAASICLRDALKEQDQMSDRIAAKLKLAKGDLDNTITECHAKIAELDPEIAKFEAEQHQLEKDRIAKREYKLRKKQKEEQKHEQQNA